MIFSEETEELKYSLEFFAGVQSLKEVYRFWFVHFCLFSKYLSLLSSVPSNKENMLSKQCNILSLVGDINAIYS